VRCHLWSICHIGFDRIYSFPYDVFLHQNRNLIKVLERCKQNGAEFPDTHLPDYRGVLTFSFPFSFSEGWREHPQVLVPMEIIKQNFQHGLALKDRLEIRCNFFFLYSNRYL